MPDEFDALHPRARAGLPNAGEFIDVLNRLAKLGAEYDKQRGVWLVPSGRRGEFESLLNEVGYGAVNVPRGMRVLREDDDVSQLGLGQKIPPGWTDVFVSDDPNAALRVVGRDAVGREQRIYSRAHTEAKSAEKFARIRLLHDHLPTLDAALQADAGTDDTAAAVLLMRRMGLRPGSNIDTKAAQQAYGATTLLRRHVQVRGDTVRLRFVGKSGNDIDREVEDREIARALVRRLKGKNGDDSLFDTNQTKVNRYLKQQVGEGFSVKDLRTYRGTAEALAILAEDYSPRPTDAASFRRMELDVGARVAAILGNDRKQALDSYIDPTAFGPRPNEEAS